VDALVTTTPHRGLLRLLGAALTTLVATLLLLAAGAPAAHAHTELVRTSPAAGSTDRPVSEVRLTFNESLTPGLAQVVVTGPDGAADTGKPVVTGTDVVVAVQGLTDAGTYQVAYRVVAADGHPVVGEFAVAVSTKSAAAAARQAADARAPSSGPEGAGSAARGSRSGAPEQLLPAGSGASVVPDGPSATSGGRSATSSASGVSDLAAVAGGGVAALVLLLGLHLVLRRSPAPAGDTP
jgi:methionine-rich copper-binding protein CopC